MSDVYSLLREFADSWALLVLFLFFVGAFAWVWRPGSRALHDDAARSIFDGPASPDPAYLAPEAEPAPTTRRLPPSRATGDQ